MRVQKTRERGSKTLELGEARLVEAVLVCAGGCQSPSGGSRTQRPREVLRRIPPGSVVGYDVLVWVGLRRFLQHQQREEMRLTLVSDYGVRVSEREVDVLAHRFLTYLEALHRARSPVLRAVLEADGGWPLHVDATGEDGRGTLLVALAGWRRWVLGAWKIPTEREDQILPHLRGVCERFGAPCAVMRDLGRALIPATATLVRELHAKQGTGAPRIRVLSCHQHFLADVGKDLLEAAHARLRALTRSSKVLPHLRAFIRNLGRSLGADLPGVRKQFSIWLADPSGTWPEGQVGRAAVRALGQWVVDYPVEGKNLRFPFDRPYLGLAGRVQKVRRTVDDLLRRAGGLDPPVDRSLRHLGRILDPFILHPELSAVMRSLTTRASLFDRLRAVLRLEHPGTDAANQLSRSPREPENLDRIRRGVVAFRKRLHRERPSRGPAQDQREAIDVVLTHLRRYAGSLWGHAIRLPAEAGGGIRLVDRTNNILESRFRRLKQGERRRSGRKNLARDFEHLPAAAALATNLTDPDYVCALCGTLDDLATAFAQLDADHAGPVTGASRNPGVSPATDIPEAIVSASLPREDRRLVRSEQLQACIEAAARSRPPRVSLRDR